MESSSIRKLEVIHKGAEASLIIGEWFGKSVIFKQRFPKLYRIEQIDKKLRTSRTLNEARALINVKKSRVMVPQVYEIDANSSTIVMKYIEGKKLKEIIPEIDESRKMQYFFTIGRYIARLHLNGHIHGDITTSNIIITPNEDIFLIDFGLHEYSDTIEDKSVDLHLFKRVLISSHGNDSKECFDKFLEGYSLEYQDSHSNEYKKVIKNIKVVESRGRYVKQEDRK